MDNKTILTAGIVAVVLSFIVCLVSFRYLSVSPQYLQGMESGYKRGQDETGQTINDAIQKNKVEGVLQATSSGQFYVEVE